MQRFILGRVIQSIASMFVVSIVVFALVRLSGDPIQIMMPAEASKADIELVRAHLGLDRPWTVQYWRFLTQALQGDFGRSVRFRRPALDLVAERYGATLELGGLAVLIVIAVALPVGVYSAVRRGSALDYAARAFAAFGQAVPPFWLGLVLVLIFGVLLHLLPTSGRGTPLHVLLPGITLGWFAVAGLMRLTRSSMLDVLGSEYVKLARIKGLPERRVIWRHAFKNAALPVVTFAALLFVALPVGVYAAVRRGRKLDYAARAFAALGQAVPPFWLGLLLVLVFGVTLHWLPTSGRGTPLHIVLPGLTLGWFAVAGLMRLTRSAMLDVLGTEYVKLARIKGLPERSVIWKHAFKNAALPVVTFAGLVFVALLNGSIIIETVFSWPGVGLLVIEAVDSRDYPIVQTVVLFLSAMYIGVNLLVDVLYAYLNPKIRYSA